MFQRFCGENSEIFIAIRVIPSPQDATQPALDRPLPSVDKPALTAFALMAGVRSVLSTWRPYI